MKNRKSDITASTRFTMIFCLCVVVFAALLLVFLMFFPIKMENPVNGVNDKLIASAASSDATTTDTTTVTTTTTTFSNTRQTTDRNRITSTTYTEAVLNNYSPSYSNNNNNNSGGNNNYVPPAVTQTPVTTAVTETIVTTAAQIITDAPATEAPVQTVPPVTEGNSPAEPAE